LRAGAHFDVWVVDYYDYRPGKQDSNVFKPPPSCQDTEIEQPNGLRSFPSQMMALVPVVHSGKHHVYTPCRKSMLANNILEENAVPDSVAFSPVLTVQTGYNGSDEGKLMQKSMLRSDCQCKGGGHDIQ